MQERTKNKFDEEGVYELFAQPFLFIGFHTKVHRIEVRGIPFTYDIMVKVFARDERHEYVVKESAVVKHMESNKELSGFHSAVEIVKNMTFMNVSNHPDEPTKVYSWIFDTYPCEPIHKVRQQQLQAAFGRN